MQTTTLYVIGNGFDLRHCIPSSLWHFKEFLRATDSDIYRDVEEYLPVDGDWCDLETALSESRSNSSFSMSKIATPSP